MYDRVRRGKCLVLMSCLIMSAVLLFSAVFAGRAAAYEVGWATPKYDVSIKASKDNSYQYTEKITVYFSQPRHGIYRYIPEDDRNYRISDISVEGAESKISTDDDQKVIRIGSKSSTITGRHTYTIRYKIAFYEEQNSSADQMYIDVLPTSWQSSIQKAHVVIDVPPDMDLGDVKTFTGTYGSKDEDYGSWDISEKDHRIEFSAEDLPAHVGATVKATLPDGYWQDPLDRRKQAMAATILFAAAAVVMIVVFARRRSAGQIVEPVEFNAPEGVTPAEAGYLIDGECEPKDVSAMLFYMADKGYLTISGKAKNNNSMKITSVKVPENENRVVWRFYTALFGRKSAKAGETGEVLTLGAAKKKIGQSYESIKSIVEDEYTGENEIYSSRSKRAGRIAMFLCFMAFIAGQVIIDGTKNIYVYFLGAVLLLIFLLLLAGGVQRRYSSKKGSLAVKTILLLVLYIAIGVCAWFMLGSGFGSYMIVPKIALSVMLAVSIPAVMIGPTMTEKSRVLIGRLRGFRNFIRTAELSRLEELVEQDPEYFYGVLPYAYVFGLTKKWAEKFEGIPLEQPGWYTSYDSNDNRDLLFDIYTFDFMTRNITEATLSAIKVSHADSGGGGFSIGGGGGGGFSGGGGGGGGGGAW